MDTQPPPAGESGSNTSRLAGATSNTDILGTQQERRHKLVHCDAANAATKHMTQDAHLKIVRKTGSSENKKQHAVACEYIYMEANGGQLTVERTAGVHRELRNEFIAARNGKPPWLPAAFSAQSAKSNIMMLSALGFSQMNFLISIPASGRNRL